MDNSREEDLRLLHERFNDTSRPLVERRRAHLRFQRIQAQMSDRVLTELRHRLIRAIQADDPVWPERFTKQIEDYSRTQWWYDQKVGAQ